MNDMQKFHKALKSDDIDEVYDALIDIGKSDTKELEPEVWSFLKNDEPDLKRAAIMVLGTYWKNPTFKDAVKTILENDLDDDVRVSALINWASYYENTNDVNVKKKLLNLIEDDAEDLFIKIEALRGLYRVSGVKHDENKFREIERIQKYTDFEKLVPWDDVKEIMST